MDRSKDGETSKRVLVLGARGTVGASLVDELLSRGHRLVMADRGLYSSPNYYKCDIAHYRQIERILLENQFDYVYNLAAEFGRWNGEQFYESLWMTNVVGFKNIVRLQEKFKFRLIH